MTDFLKLTGKTALVIGGGLGMGEATAMTLAQAGCNVALVDCEADRAERVAAQIRALGREALPLVMNALDADSAARCVAAVNDTLGVPDILVTIVGQAAFTPATEISPELWDFDHARNLRYVFFHAQAVAKAMIAAGQGGSIVAVASVSGVQSAPRHAAYGAAKAGLINLVKSLGVEWAGHGIRVNAVSPGAIGTPRLSGPEYEARVARSLIPCRRLGTPQEIANAILFLASDLATFVTGHNLAVDGGFTAQFLLGMPED